MLTILGYELTWLVCRRLQTVGWMSHDGLIPGVLGGWRPVILMRDGVQHA